MFVSLELFDTEHKPGGPEPSESSDSFSDSTSSNVTINVFLLHFYAPITD